MDIECSLRQQITDMISPFNDRLLEFKKELKQLQSGQESNEQYMTKLNEKLEKDKNLRDWVKDLSTK